MITLPFELQPFNGVHECHAIIEGIFEFKENSLKINYKLSKVLEDYLFDFERKLHERVDGLWQRSCAEFFIKGWNSTQYIEVNIAPSGQWQSYLFADYRKERVEFDGLILSKFDLVKSDLDFELKVEFDLSNHQFWKHSNFNMGVSFVLERMNKNYHYMALMHLADEPDFHHPESFSLYF